MSAALPLVPVPRLSVARIAAARAVIDPRFLHSPQAACAATSAWLGCDVVLKDDSANPLGSFKGRGAHAFLATRGERTPVVCASAGNFGMALAHAGRRQRVAVTVFVSRHANAAKVDGIRRYGAQVRVAGDDFDAAKVAAREYAAANGLHFVEDGREVAISEGAGTIGIELLESDAKPDAVVLPLGNGALLAGVGTWVKAHAPRVRVMGVVARGAPVMRDAWAMAKSGGIAVGGSAPRGCDTIADGIAVRVPVQEAIDDLLPVVDDVIEVDDDALLRALRELHRRTGRTVEASAVAGLAAIDAHRHHFAGQRVATVLTGRNLTREQRAEWF